MSVASRSRAAFAPGELAQLDALDDELRGLTEHLPRGANLTGRAAANVQEQRAIAAAAILREQVGGRTSH